MPTESSSQTSRAPRRLVLIDHSLRRPGGHNPAYAKHLLTEALRAGMQPVLVTHVDYAKVQETSDWPILPRFHATMYQLSRIAERAERFLPLRPLYAIWLWSMKRRFGRSLRDLLAELDLRSDDVVFFPSTGTLELPEILGICASERSLQGPTIHAMLHAPAEIGRIALDRAPRASMPIFTRDAPANMRIHATNDALALHLRSLGLARCEELPWMIDPEIAKPRTHAAGRDGQPIRIGFPGGSRDERGSALVESVFEGLRGDLLDGSRVQLLMQASSPARLPSSLHAHASFHDTTASALDSRTPIAVVRWPLSNDDYAAFVRSTDVGLLPYDPDRYYARASGVLVEMLAAGIPVVTLAGCWLGRQLRGAAWRHADGVMSDTRTTAIPCGLPPRATIGATPHVIRVDIPAAIDAPALAALTFRWISPASDESALLVAVRGGDASADAASSWRELVERRTPEGEIATTRFEPIEQTVLLPIEPLQRSAIIELHVPAHLPPVTIEGARLALIARRDGADAGNPPLSAVGVQAADPDMLARCLREACVHQAHYRETAERAAPRVRTLHVPSHTLQCIMR